MKNFIELPDGSFVRKSWINSISRIVDYVGTDEEPFSFYLGGYLARFKTEAGAIEFRNKVIEELEK